ncbi:T9SS type A sorting domain-containing protein [Marivirga salinae]|uniref:T9SS type A sorting domain-containing protein n=1 Tax=Marivirga salinarum TaxID=3059078 RepID=A0AA51NCS3_9BACT|nr:T9SS type A sorting domain-containing protein [Marivirga sp. BDSF4-3]WMN12904.1 T9SS type A sorting domain-containing protein [Marivirga sp. BDSF4-3]
MKKFYSPLKSLLSLFFILFALNVHAADYFWIGGSGDINDLNHWATTSGGSTLHTNLPGEDDDLFFDANSFSADGQTVTFNVNIGVRDFNASNVSNAIIFTGSGDFNIYGSLYIGVSVELDLDSNRLSFYSNEDGEEIEIAQGNMDIDDPKSNNISFLGSGSYTFLSNFSAANVFHYSGTIIFGANEFDFGYFNSINNVAKHIDITNAIINLSHWSIASYDVITLESANSTINVSRDFKGNNLDYFDVNILMPDFFNTVSIEDDNSFDNLTVAAGIEVEFQAESQQTITNALTVNGTASEVVEFVSSTEGSTATIIGSGINVSGDYLNITDVDFTGSGTFSLENSLVLDDSQGWEINSVPTPTGNGQFYFSKIYSDSIYLGLTAGGGQERIVFIREGTYPDVTVADDTEYTANTTFGQGQLVGTDTYVIYQGNDKQVKIDGLQPNTEYYFSRMEVNSTPDNSSVKYQSTSTSFAKIMTTLESGNIYMHNGEVSVNTGDSFYDEGGNGSYFPNKEQVLTLNSAEAGKSVKLTFNELEVRSYEKLRIFDGADTTATLLESYSGDTHSLPLSVSSSGESLTVKFESADFETSSFSSKGWQADVDITLPAPTQMASELTVENISDSTIRIKFYLGNGDDRMILIQKGTSPITFTPTDNQSYADDFEIGTVRNIRANNISSFGSGWYVTMDKLDFASEYTVKIIEYNESNGEITYAEESYETVVDNIIEAPSDDFSKYDLDFYSYDQPFVKIEKIRLSGPRVDPSSDFRNEKEANYFFLISEQPISESLLRETLKDNTRFQANEQFGLGTEIAEGVFVVTKRDNTFYDTEISGLKPSTDYYFATMLFRENRVGLTYGWNTLRFNKFTTRPENSIFLNDTVDYIDSVKFLYDPTGFAGTIWNYEDITQTFYPEQSTDKLSYQNLGIDSRVGGNTIFDLRVFDGTDSLAPLLIDYEELTVDGINSDSVIQATNSQGALTFVYKKLWSGYTHKGFYGRLFPVQAGEQEPTQSVSNFEATTTKEGTADINFVRGNGDRVVATIVNRYEESPSYIDGLDYQFNKTLKDFFTNGSQVVYNGAGNNFSINNLVPGKSYDIYFAEANGEGKNIAYAQAKKYTFNVPENRPTIAAKNLDFLLINDSTVNLSWENGNGEERIVLITLNRALFNTYQSIDGRDLPSVNGGLIEDFYRVNVDNGYSNSTLYLAYSGTGNSVNVSSKYLVRQLYNTEALKFYVLEYYGDENAKNYLSSEHKTFSFIPKIGTNKLDGSYFTISEIDAVSFKLSYETEAYYYPYESVVVVSEKGVADNTIPFESGLLPNGFTEIKNGLVGTFENKKVYFFDRPSNNYIKGLKPNTDYTVTIYNARFTKLASTITNDQIYQRDVATSNTSTYYWVNGSGNWVDLSHWATSSGGKTKHSTLPDNSSEVIFDENSVSSATKDSVVISTEEMALFSFDAKSLPNKLSFVYEDISSSIDQVNIASSFELNDSLNFFADNLTLRQALEGNKFRSNIASTILSIEIMPSKNHLNIKNVFSLMELKITNANVSFEPQSSISVEDISFNNSIIHNMPRWEGVNSISSDIKLPYVETGNRDYFNTYSNVDIDSLFLNIHKVYLKNQSTLQVEEIINNSQKTVLLTSLDGIANIKTNSDSLIVDNFYIKNNFALGSAVYYAKNSALLENTKGWINDNDSFPDVEAEAEAIIITGLKTEISLKLYNYLSFGGLYISLREANKPHKGPGELENLNANSVYSEASGEEQLLYLNTNFKFDFNRPLLNISNLSPDTEYILSFYSCYKSGDQVIFSEDRREKKFKTLKKDDILMFREGGDVIVDGRKNLYGVNGFETGEFPFERSEVTLYPNSNSKKIALTALQIRDIETDMDVSIFDGIDTSANKILDSRLSARGENLESIFQDNYPKASNAEGALTVVLEGYTSASSYSKGPKFIVYESNGVVANEPTVQASNVEISDKNQNTATITWTKGDGNRTLVSIFEGYSSFGSSIFNDGIKWNANNIFRLGDRVGDRYTQYIVYTGEGDSITIDSLKADTRYGVMALTYNVSETEDPNYMNSDVVTKSFYTTPNAPVQLPQNFSIFDREPISTNFTFQDSVATGALILIKENEAVDLSLATDSIKNQNTSGYVVDFTELDSLEDGARIYFNDNYSDMNYYLEGLKESTEYHYAIFNYRENSVARVVNENALTGSFKTQDASYKINGFNLPNNSLQGEEICMGANIKIYYNYTGTNEGDNSAIPIISNSLGMSDSTLLDVISEEDGLMIVSLPEDLDSGMHYFSMIPELGSDFKIYIDSLNIQPIQEIEITRNNNKLVVNDSVDLRWYRNDALISQENDSILQLTSEGTYYASKTAANCEYFSNEIYVKAKVTFTEDSVQSCIDELVEIEFENTLGNLSDSFNYYALLLDNSGNEQNLELESIDLNNNLFSLSLPKNLPTDYYSIILKAEGDSIESDTTTLYIENMEPAIITLTESGLSSNYEEGNQWFFNGEPINGATSQSISIDRSGVYSVEVSTEFCSVKSEGITLTSNRRGLSAVGFRAYPNPIRNDLNLKYTGDEYLGLSSVVITDLTGKAIYNGLHDFQNEKKLEIPLSEINAGVYFITVETNSYRAQQKLIKK